MYRIGNKRRRKNINTYFLALLFLIAFGLAQIAVLPFAYAQDEILTVAVLVNSGNTTGYNTNPSTPGEYQRYPERYLEHLQVPYEIFDVSTQSPPADLSSRQLIIIGHKGVNLPTAWQTAVVNAVSGGTGLVNLDWATNIGTASYIQTIFGATGSSAGTPGTAITVPQEVASGGSNPHYIAAMQKKFLGDPPGDFVYNFHVDQNNILQTATSTVLTNASGTVIARIGSNPLIVAASYGLGRAVHFGTLDYLRADRFGFLMGIDDLFWRSLVWAARKPFVLRGYPRLWAVQMDDTNTGWGFRVRDIYDPAYTGNVAPDGTGGPWKLTGFVYTDNLPAGSSERTSVAADIRDGLLKVAPHTFGNVTYGNLYWNDGSGALTDTQWLANISQVLAWRDGLGGNDAISTSRSLVPHYWDLSDNTGYDLWNSLGIRYLTSIQKPGFQDYADVSINGGAERPHARPFWLYEQPPKTVADENYSFFFADDYPVNSRSGLPSKNFFLFASQMHDPGLNYPRPDVIWPSNGWNFAPADSIDQFERYTWRFWSSLAPVQIFTHDYYNYESASASDRQEVISQVSSWLADRGVYHVFMEELGDYIYSRTKSVLTGVQVSGSNITYTLTGNSATADGTPVTTGALVFFDNTSEGVLQTLSGFVGGATYTLQLPQAPPVIDSVTPPTGPVSGGTVITINGANFVDVTAVKVGGNPVTNLVVGSSTQITATTPAGLTGTADVVVVTASGMTTLANGFTYLGPPIIDSVTPEYGPQAGGTLITITGRGFEPTSTVTVGGAPATGVNVVDATTLTATTPAGTPGPVGVAVSNSQGTTTLTGGFFYLSASDTIHMDFTYASRSALLAAGWDFLAKTFSGVARDTEETSGLVVSYDQTAHPGSLRIPINSGDIWENTNDSQNTLFFSLPDIWHSIRLKISGVNLDADLQQVGIVAYQDDNNFVIINRYYNSALPGSQTVEFGFESLGSYEAIDRVAAPAGTVIYLRLDKASATNTITAFFSTDGINWQQLSGSVTQALTSPRLAVLTGANQSSTSFPSVDVNYAEIITFESDPPAPAISSATPPSGSTLGGTAMQISGSGFAADSTVTIGGTSPTSIVVNSDTSITAVTPAGTAGAKDVVVTNTNGTSTLSGGFTYYVPDSVLFEDNFDDGNADGWTISPLGNAAGWGVSGGAYTYDGGGISNSYAGEVSWSDYTLSVKVRLSTLSNFPGGIRGRVNPATGAGYAVWLYPASGEIKLFRATGWDIDSAGLTELGTVGSIPFDTTNFHTVWLSFTGTTIDVYYDGVLKISATDATYGNGAVALDVSNQAVAFDDVSVVFGLPVLPPSPPAISSISPPSGSTLGGTAVQISGSGFAADSTVTIGGTSATGVVVNSDTSISAVTPVGAAGAADVVVTNDNGTATLSGGFTYFTPGSVLFQDDFSGGAGNWTISSLGHADGWSVVSGAYTYNGAGISNSYAGGDPSWSDYTFAAKIRLSTLSNFPGGIRGRVNPATGAGYTVWLYPASGEIKLLRVAGWDPDNPPATELGAFGGITFDTTSFHTVWLSFEGTSINVYYDGELKISATDTTYDRGVIALDVSDQPVEFDDVSVVFGAPVLPVTVSSVSPLSGPTTGGTAVQISGSGFIAGSTVTIGGASATSVVVNNSTSISAVTPAGTAGPADVVVTNTNGTDTLAGGFTYYEPGSVLFADDFSDNNADGWTISPLGNAAGWSVVGGVYTYIYSSGGASNSYAGNVWWSDYTVAAKIRLSTLSNYPGGIRGRVNPATGAGYAVWLYPESGEIKLWRVTGWDINAAGLTDLGTAGGITFDTTNFHSLALSFTGSAIKVYYDGAPIIDATDATYGSGGIALDVDNQSVEFDDVTVAVDKADQTISVITAAPGNAAYNSTFTVAATASSTLPVTYGVTAGSAGVCTVNSSSGLVTMIGSSGNCTITIDQAGDSMYNAASQVTTGPTEATKANQATVTVIATTPLTYGGSTGTATASGGSGTGAYSYSAGTSTACSVNVSTGVITVTSGTGTCSITATRAADSNYNVSAVSAAANVTINKADQAAVTVNATTPLTYGGSAGTATASGGSGTGAYSYSAGTSTACSVNSSTGVITVTSGTGTCSITATRAGDSNYNVSAVSAAANVTVSKANQATVTVIATTPLTYGGSTGTATASGGSGTGAYSYSAGTSTACSVNSSTGVITVTSGTGTCSITATRAGDSNYNVSAASAPANVTVIPGYVMRGSTYYSTLQGALNDAENVDFLIEAQELTPSEDINFNPITAISITLRGGYDQNFTSPPAGYTTMNSMTITNGSVTIDRLIIQ